jgi:hypothetical protein
VRTRHSPINRCITTLATYRHRACRRLYRIRNNQPRPHMQPGDRAIQDAREPRWCSAEGYVTPSHVSVKCVFLFRTELLHAGRGFGNLTKLDDSLPPMGIGGRERERLRANRLEVVGPASAVLTLADPGRESPGCRCQFGLRQAVDLPRLPSAAIPVNPGITQRDQPQR